MAAFLTTQLRSSAERYACFPSSLTMPQRPSNAFRPGVDACGDDCGEGTARTGGSAAAGGAAFGGGGKALGEGGNTAEDGGGGKGIGRVSPCAVRPLLDVLLFISSRRLIRRTRAAFAKTLRR